MEIPEMGSYDEIAMAHQRLTAAPKTPSGHANMYGGIKWAFPGDVNPTYSSAIMRAVNCQLRWDSPLVTKELSVIFRDPVDSEIMDWVNETREATVRMVKANWEVTKEMEIAAYGPDKDNNVPDRSFFNNQGVHPPRETEWWAYDGQVEMTTALEQFRRQLSTSREESVLRETTDTPLQTPRRGSMRSSTGSLTPASQLSDLSRRGGSPMDIDEPSGGNGSSSHRRTSSRVQQLKYETSTGSPVKGKGKGRQQ
jgi:hypothetical protein